MSLTLLPPPPPPLKCASGTYPVPLILAMNRPLPAELKFRENTESERNKI